MSVSRGVEKSGLISLERAPEGFEGYVSVINGGGRFLQRLMALGIIPGMKIKVIRNSYLSPIIVEASDTRIAVGRGMASKVLLTDKDENLGGNKGE